MAYGITILRSAQKQLAKIDPKQQRPVVEAIKTLANNPRPTGCKKLSGRPAWRIRIGNYRVIYEVRDSELVILIIDIGHRKDIYR